MRALVLILLAVAGPLLVVHGVESLRFRRRVRARLAPRALSHEARGVPVLLPASVRVAQWASMSSEGTAPAATVTAPSDRRAHHGSTAVGQRTVVGGA